MAIAVTIGASACDRRAPPPPTPAPPPSTTAPVDQLLPGEMAEGPESAFGLPIPRRMKIDARFADAVFASGTMAPELVANYVRERVVAEHVDTGPVKTVFSKATPKSAPQRVVRVEVVLEGSATQLVVRDETRPPAKDGLTEAERWKELGLTPQGTPLDPTHLE